MVGVARAAGVELGVEDTDMEATDRDDVNPFDAVVVVKDRRKLGVCVVERRDKLPEGFGVLILHAPCEEDAREEEDRREEEDGLEEEGGCEEEDVGVIEGGGKVLDGLGVLALHEAILVVEDNLLVDEELLEETREVDDFALDVSVSVVVVILEVVEAVHARAVLQEVLVLVLVDGEVVPSVPVV